MVPAKVEDAIDQFDEPDTQEIEYDEQEFYAQIPTETGLKESLVKGNNKKEGHIQSKQKVNPNDTNSIDPNVSNSKAESINISDEEKEKLKSQDNSRH